MSGARAWRVGAGALFAVVVAIASAQTMLPKSVDTPALTMTGIGEPTAPHGSARKPLPALVPTDAMAMTGLGDSIAPPGATRKPLPALVPTDAMAMTGVGPAN